MACPDHFLYGVSNLEEAVATIEAETGLKATPGGRHENIGTRNAFIGLADDMYIELLAPDPEQSRDASVASILYALPENGLIGWCARSDNLDALATAYVESNTSDIIGPTNWRRHLPDGGAIDWQLLHVSPSPIGALQPFFINWGETPHPTENLHPQGACTTFSLTSPHTTQLKSHLEAAQLDIEQSAGPENSIVLKVDTGRSIVTLKSVSPLPFPLMPNGGNAS